MNVIIAPNIRKQSARIDVAGNEIDKNTHQVIHYANEGAYIPSQEERQEVEQKGNTPIVAGDIQLTTDPRSIETKLNTPKAIQDEINATEAHLARLKELKKTKIEEMKQLLAELESE